MLEKGEGVYVWDVDGKKYFDFLSAYSAVNQVRKVFCNIFSLPQYIFSWHAGQFQIVYTSGCLCLVKFQF